MTTFGEAVWDQELESSISAWVCWTRDHIPRSSSSLPIKLTEEQFNSARDAVEDGTEEWHLLVPWWNAVRRLLDAASWLPKDADIEQLRSDSENYCKAFVCLSRDTKYDLAGRFTSSHFFQTALEMFLSIPEVDIALRDDDAELPNIG